MHSQTLIISNLELLLNYCIRFYDRQFYTRTNLNQDLVSKFETLLKDYYALNKQEELGIPTVQYCGAALNMSPKYLSDLLKKETGSSTQDHIHKFIIEKAKYNLLNSTVSASEIAYNLGFEYPQYFSKIFKKKISRINRFKMKNKRLLSFGKYPLILGTMYLFIDKFFIAEPEEPTPKVPPDFPH